MPSVVGRYARRAMSGHIKRRSSSLKALKAAANRAHRRRARQEITGHHGRRGQEWEQFDLPPLVHMVPWQQLPW